MATLYLCGISAFVACLLGIPLGVLASRSDRFERFLNPIIDTLQTLPSFCFIIPVVMLFRIGDVTGMIATVPFAIRQRDCETPDAFVIHPKIFCEIPRRVSVLRPPTMFEVPGGLVRGSPRWLETDRLTVSDASGARPFCKKQTRMESSQKPFETKVA